VSVHVFTVSAGLVGVCLTVIGIVRISINLKSGYATIADELLAVDALIFMTACVLAYTSLRSPSHSRAKRLEGYADRQSYVAGDGSTRREALRLSFFTTAGELAGQFRVVESDDPSSAPESRVTWTPPAPADVPDVGLEVHFTVVVRDLRGGIDWTTRTVCVRR